LMMSAQKAAQGSDGMALYRQGGNLMSVYAPVRLVSRPAIFLTRRYRCSEPFLLHGLGRPKSR